MVEGGVKQLNVVYTPTQAADENPATFESDKEDVATVDNDGKVTAQGAGTAVITVTAGGKTGTITINVSAPKWFVKATVPSILADKDTIVLANETVMAGNFDSTNKKLTPLTSGFTADDMYAYSDDAQRLVVNIENSKDTTLTLAGTTSKLSNPTGGELQLNKANDKWWFKADGTGVYVINVGTQKYIAYNSQGQSFIRTYNSSSYPKLYVYVRSYKAPAAVENIEVEAVPAQKLLHEGRIVILRDGVMYELDGRRMK